MDINKFKPALEKKINELGYELIELSTRKEKGDLILSVVVDKVEPIDMKMIVEVTDEVSKFLDEVVEGDEKYLLDVSSLGAEKPLKIEDLDKYVGRYVHVHLTNPINGENIYEGELSEVSTDSITLTYRIKTRVKQVVILQSNIYKIRLAIKF